MFSYIRLSYLREIIEKEISIEDFFKRNGIFYQRMDKIREVEIEWDEEKDGDENNIITFFKRINIDFRHKDLKEEK